MGLRALDPLSLPRQLSPRTDGFDTPLFGRFPTVSIPTVSTRPCRLPLKSGSGGSSITASVAVTLDGATVSSTASAFTPITATASVSLDGATVSSTAIASTAIAASGAMTLDGATVSSTASVGASTATSLRIRTMNRPG